MIAIAAVLLIAAGPALPAEVIRQVPKGYVILASARVAVRLSGREFAIVALGRQDEGASARTSGAPARPLMVYERQRSGHFAQVGRNDRVVLVADEGGQCNRVANARLIEAMARQRLARPG